MLKVLFLVALPSLIWLGLAVDSHRAEGSVYQPVFQGDIQGLKVMIQGHSAAFMLASRHNVSQEDKNCMQTLFSAMQKTGVEQVILTPQAVRLYPVSGSELPDIKIKIPDINPTPTFKAMPTGIGDIDDTPGLLFINQTTMSVLAKLLPTTITTLEWLPQDSSDETVTIDFDALSSKEPLVFSTITLDTYGYPSTTAPTSRHPYENYRKRNSIKPSSVQLRFSDQSSLQVSPQTSIYTSSLPDSTIYYQPKQIPVSTGQQPDTQFAGNTASTAANTESSPLSLSAGAIAASASPFVSGQTASFIGDSMQARPQLPSSRKQWIKLEQEYQGRGVLVRMLKKNPDDRRSVGDKVVEMLGVNVAPGTYLFPGASIKTFSPGVGLVYKATLPAQGRYKKNARTGYRFRPTLLQSTARTSKARSHDVTFSKTLPYSALPISFLAHPLAHPNLPLQQREKPKKHYNLYSFLLKLQEQTYSYDQGRAGLECQRFTSGHLDASGRFTQCKQRLSYNYITDVTGIPHNEVLAEWQNPIENLLGIVWVLENGYLTENLGLETIEVLKVFEDNNANPDLIPIILYNPSKPQMSYLGSAATFIAIFQNIDHQTYFPFTVPAENHRYLDYLKEHGLSYLQSKCNHNHHVHMQDFPMFSGWNLQFKFCNLLEYESFADNVQRLCDGLAQAGRGIYNHCVLALLNCATQRQLLESRGVCFTDDEAIMLGFASIFTFALSGTNIPNLLDLFWNSMHDSGAPDLMTAELINLMRGQVPEDFESNHDRKLLLYYFLLSSYQQDHLFVYPISKDFPCVSLGHHQELRQLLRHLSDELPTLKLCKGHAWPSLLRDLLLRLKFRLAERLEREGLSLQSRPFSAMAIVLPGDMSILEVLQGAMIPSLVDHYRRTTPPLYTGTLREEEASSAMMHFLYNEKCKVPTATEGSHQICIRPWEAIHDLFSDISINSRE